MLLALPAFPTAIATAGLAWDYIFIFIDLSCSLALDFLLHSLPRVICAILIFIFIDPCAGRHLLSLLRQSKQRKALHTTSA
jgi:hypothetical protein